MDNIYIVRGTEQAGPFTESEIRAQLASGTLSSDTLVWWEGLPEWTALSNTPLATVATPAPLPSVGAIPAPISPAPAAAAPLSEFAPVAPAPVPGTGKTSALALASLITGVVAIPTVFCYGIGLLAGLAAVITGHMARGQFKKNPGESGEGMALAGLICGYISMALFLLAVVAVSVLIALGNQVKGTFKTIQSEMQTNNAPATPNP